MQEKQNKLLSSFFKLPPPEDMGKETHETYALIQARCEKSFLGFDFAGKKALGSMLEKNWLHCSTSTIVIVLKLLMPDAHYHSESIQKIIGMTDRGNLERDLQLFLNPKSVTRTPTPQTIQGGNEANRAIFAARDQEDAVRDQHILKNWRWFLTQKPEYLKIHNLKAILKDANKDFNEKKYRPRAELLKLVKALIKDVGTSTLDPMVLA